MASLDKEILSFIIQNRISLINPIMIWMEYIGHQLIVATVTTLLFLYKKKHLIILWMTLIASVMITYILKHLIQRSRPIVDSLIQKVGYSFPSGHVTLAFSVFPLISKEYPKLRYIWLVFAVLIAFSRLYIGVHFPSDVIAAAAIGYLIGKLMLYIQVHHLKFYVR